MSVNVLNGVPISGRGFDEFYGVAISDSSRKLFPYELYIEETCESLDELYDYYGDNELDDVLIFKVDRLFLSLYLNLSDSDLYSFPTSKEIDRIVHEALTSLDSCYHREYLALIASGQMMTHDEFLDEKKKKWQGDLSRKLAKMCS